MNNEEVGTVKEDKVACDYMQEQMANSKIRKEDAKVVVKYDELMHQRSIKPSEITNLVINNCISKLAIYRNLGNYASNQLSKFKGITTDSMSGIQSRPISVVAENKKDISLKRAKTQEELSYIAYVLRELNYKVDAPSALSDSTYFQMIVEDNKILNVLTHEITYFNYLDDISIIDKDNRLAKTSLNAFICDSRVSVNAKPYILKALRQFGKNEEHLLFIKSGDEISCFVYLNNNVPADAVKPASYLPLTKDNLLKLNSIKSATESQIQTITEPYERFKKNKEVLNKKLSK